MILHRLYRDSPEPLQRFDENPTEIFQRLYRVSKQILQNLNRDRDSTETLPILYRDAAETP